MADRMAWRFVASAKTNDTESTLVSNDEDALFGGILNFVIFVEAMGGKGI